MSNFKFNQFALTCVIVGLFLTGCGGGGGSSTPPSPLLSGTVAGGAAVIGNVIVTDSKGATKGATIEANGGYSIDVSGMTGPFVLKAAGMVGNTHVTYYSAATSADVGGTVNVTPFTNLIVSNIAAQLAETYFSNPANLANLGTLITPAKLAAAETALQAKLAPVLAALGIDKSIDLLRSSFAVNHTGIDALLDLIKVEVDTSTNVATLRNALTQAVLGTDDATSSADDATPVDFTDQEAILGKLAAWAALFTTDLPTIPQLEASGVFDTSSSFMMSGESFAQFATEMSTDPLAVGLKFTDVAVGLDAGGASATVTVRMISDSSTKFGTIQLKLAKINGVWLIQGDGRIANMSLLARAQRNEWVTYNQSYSVISSGAWMMSGLGVWVDPFAYNSSHTSAPIAKALITGPGLGTGLTLVPHTQSKYMVLEGVADSPNVAPECGVAIQNGPAARTSQCVNVSQALDNSEYTVVLKDANGNALNGAGYKLILSKQPYATSALTAAIFPTITSITIDGQAVTPSMVAANKTVAVSWSMPAGLSARYTNIWANTATGATYLQVAKELLPTATSALFAVGTPLTTGTVTNVGLWVEGRDAFGRQIGTSTTASLQ